MTTSKSLANQRLSLLLYAQEINNISQACRIFGVSRELYYKYKYRFDKYGYPGLEERRRSSPRMPNKTKPQKEKKILEFAIQNPTFGPQRVANELKKDSVGISAGGVYNILKRHQLNRRYDRLLALEKQSLENGVPLSREQIQALERLQPPQRHIHAPYAGYLFNQDTFYIGHLKGMGKVYAQVGIDCYASFGFARIYTDKTAASAANFLISHVLPVYDMFGLSLNNLLTDNGKEYTTHWLPRGKVHIYERVLKERTINHRYTRPRTPRTNGFVERFNRTLLDEFFTPNFRKKVYTSWKQLQKDLDQYLVYYNTRRTHQGRNLKGKVPMEKFVDYAGPKRLTA